MSRQQFSTNCIGNFLKRDTIYVVNTFWLMFFNMRNIIHLDHANKSSNR